MVPPHVQPPVQLGEKVKILRPGDKFDPKQFAPGDRIRIIRPVDPAIGKPVQIEPHQIELELKLPKGAEIDGKLMEQLHKALAARDRTKAREMIDKIVAVQAQTDARLEEFKRAMAQARADLDLLRQQKARALSEEQKARQEWVERMAKKGLMPQTSQKVLGLSVEKPPAVVADQLNLPRGMGLVVTDVLKGSSAQKAGFQVNDVLLSVADHAVPSEPKALQDLLAELKPGTAFDVTLLRKGAKMTLHGLKLSSVSTPAAFNPQKEGPLLPKDPVAVPKMPPVIGQKGIVADGDKNVLTTTFRAGDRFTMRRQEGSLVITVTGKIAGGKAQVGEVHVQDGAVVGKYRSLAEVPVQYRDKAAHLIQLSARPPARTPTPYYVPVVPPTPKVPDAPIMPPAIR